MTDLERECKEVIKMLLDGYANGMTDLQIAKAFNTLNKLNEKTNRIVEQNINKLWFIRWVDVAVVLNRIQSV